MNRSHLGIGALACFGLGFLAAGLIGRSQSSPSSGATQSGTAKPQAATAALDDGKLRIICFGAHPDDCELQAGGVAAMWAALGHHVKFVSVTNGDIGHWREAGGPLALRRTAEVRQASGSTAGSAAGRPKRTAAAPVTPASP